MTSKKNIPLHLKMIARALEPFAENFAIYDEFNRLVFANTAAFESMPIYFNALAEGQPLRTATKRQIKKNSPKLSDSALENATTAVVAKLKSGEFYEVPTTGNRVVQVTHQKLDAKFTLGIGMDVTNLKRQKAKLKSLADENFNLANTDQLTKLANRRHFVDTLNNKILESETSGKPFFVGLIDLNGFKRLNDLYGHTIGDELLTNLGKVILNFVNDGTFVARLGGDEFALLVDSETVSEKNLLTYGDELCEAISQPSFLSGNTLSVSASLGWACFPKDGQTSSDLLRKSDYALYKSKYSKNQKSVVFSRSDETVILKESETILQLETADLENELCVEFQPIHDTKNENIIGFEALSRWDSPVLGLIPPVDFIPLAEKTGHISKLSKILLKKSLKTASQWPQTIPLHFNISAIDLGKIEVVKDLISIIKNSGYPTKSVIFEVTETALIDTFEKMSATLDLFEDSGIRLALDDFGVGYSNLSYLTRIPVTCLKIDKSFTKHLSPGSDKEKILKTVKYLCENLEIDCVVEGAEELSQVEQLTSLGLFNIQGFHFSRSLKAQDLPQYLLRFVSNKCLAAPGLSEDREKKKA